MVKEFIPSSSDQSPCSEDEFMTSVHTNSRTTRSKIFNKRKNDKGQKSEKDDIPPHKFRTRNSLADKQEKLEELKNRFGYLPNKRENNINESSDDGLETCSSENYEPSSLSAGVIVDTNPGSSVGNQNVRMSVKPKSDFKIKFSSSNFDILPEEDKGIVKTCNHLQHRGSMVLRYISSISQGQNCCNTLKQARRETVASWIAAMDIFAQCSVFNRRVTALTYHPKYPSVLAVGSKGGELIFWNTQKLIPELTIPELGPGGSVLAMKFHHEKETVLYTSSLTGRVMQQDFLGKENMTFYDTGSFDIWFSSLDTSVPQKLLLAGDTRGFLYLSDFNCEKIWRSKKKVHKNKVTHVEFSPKDPYIFVTASLDHTVRIWDLRMFSDQEGSPPSIHCLQHEKGVNSAYFSPSDGTSLLTTDQQNELRVYAAPLWHLETSIAHPHRQFQYLTPIKAQWHPMEDLIVVGRFPDETFCTGETRSIDIYDGHTGEKKHYFSSSNIACLNAFNPTGDVLTSASGATIILRKTKKECKDAVNISNAAAHRLLKLKHASRTSHRSRRKLVTDVKSKNRKEPKK